eukprot:GHUV01034350.1.p2 GENE.GHUV01034350.1~~GHUV01034350.1.p2  ORF type:complete len:165 (-),score=46.46 GHUV01034350.1:686-1180(-)
MLAATLHIAAFLTSCPAQDAAAHGIMADAHITAAHQKQQWFMAETTRTFIAARCSGVLPAFAATSPIVSLLEGAASAAPALTNCFNATAWPRQAAWCRGVRPVLVVQPSNLDNTTVAQRTAGTQLKSAVFPCQRCTPMYTAAAATATEGHCDMYTACVFCHSVC